MELAIIAIIIILIIIFAFVGSLKKQDTTFNQEMNYIETMEKKFQNNETLSLWAQEIATYIENDIKQDPNIYKEYHIGINFDKIAFGYSFLSRKVFSDDIFLEYYFSKYNLPDLDENSIYAMSRCFIKMVFSKIETYLKNNMQIYDEVNNNDIFTCIRALCYKPTVTGTW